MTSKPPCAFVQTIGVAQENQDGWTGEGAERYPLAGMFGNAHSVCFGPVAGDDVIFGEAQPERKQQQAQVAEIHSRPSGSDLPNVKPKAPIQALVAEYHESSSMRSKSAQLAQAYSHWRSIRGDGNCYYRAMIFGLLEVWLESRDMKRYRGFLGKLQQVRYESPMEQRAHENMLQLLRTWEFPEQLELWVATDVGLDQALIRASRRLVRLFLIRNADNTAPNGLTYRELLSAFNMGVEDFCSTLVDPMGTEAETLIVSALPALLGVGIRLLLLDRRTKEDECVQLDTPGPDGKVDLHVLFKPGHYDLLYPISGTAVPV